MDHDKEKPKPSQTSSFFGDEEKDKKYASLGAGCVWVTVIGILIFMVWIICCGLKPLF